MTTIRDEEEIMQEQLLRTNCPRDCYDSCGILVEKKTSGIRVLGDPEHPIARGKLCSKCAVAYNGVWQDTSQRLTHPLKRNGPKGEGVFEAISWDEACSEISTRLKPLIDSGRTETILQTHYSGTLSLMASSFPCRFFNFLGASEVDPDSICNAAGHTAWHLMFGNSVLGLDPRTMEDSNCILVWGANPSHSAPHTHDMLIEQSASLVVVDPITTKTAACADLHLKPRPGTDAALAFGLLHLLEKSGCFDTEFITNHTIGFDLIKESIDQCTPAWTQAMTGVPEADLQRAATLYGDGPSVLWAGQGMQRQATGGNAMRAIGLLPALTGNIGKPGAGISYLNLATIVAGLDFDWLEGAGLNKNPGKTISHMEFAERLSNPDEFQVLFVWNTNPVASAADQRKLRKALERDDLFTVVVDCFGTDTADYADIILPAASFLEFDDLTYGYFHMLIGVQSKAIEPPGLAVPNQEIFRRLAATLDLDEPALLETDASMISAMLDQMNLDMSFPEFQARGHILLGESPYIFFSDLTFSTPSGKIEIDSAAAEDLGASRTPVPHADSAPEKNQFRLLTPASDYWLNDSYANDPHLLEIAGEPVVYVHPEDARQLELLDGDPVALHNDSGHLDLICRIDSRTQPGTLVSYKGRWPKFSCGVNVNQLHTPLMSDLGKSTSVHSTIVGLSRRR